MKVATTISDFHGYTQSWADAVQQFEGTGFRYLDFNFHSGYYPNSPFLGPNWMEDVEKAAQAAEKLGFRFVQAHAPGYDPLNPTADHESGMLGILRSIEACAFLGIANVVVHPGSSKAYTYPHGKQEFWKKNQEFYEKLYPAMEKFQVNVLIENSATGNMEGKYFFFSGEEMAAFLDKCNHPLLHACWDTGHANMDHRDQYQDILDLGDHLRAIHFADNFGVYDEHIAPFMGTLDVDAIIQGLLDVGYKGYLTFESNNLLQKAGTWPHFRQENPKVRKPRLQSPSLELRRKAEGLLYEIGKCALRAYDCFEE